ncbi:MAG: hypothetical protein FJ135_05850 [Deltaproteobacteria bacterium]|nr:hypothetical protein [Deltaproteobacteria bacterium]
MQQRITAGGFLFWVMLVILAGLLGPAGAQPLPEEEQQVEPVLQVVIHELQVIGERDPAAVREAITAILPDLAECVQAEHRRLGRVPARMTLRFNLGGSGRVVWCKVVDPEVKSLDACLCRALGQLRLPPLEETRSRVTVVLEAKLDHLLMP